ncbi:MAG: cell division ATP-binding protein FtsE [Thermoanaerobacteraceae bacterium]|nr:cell division ATP-binding protein FtsE [Thermoanaerobacteraceae bacterium]
MIHLYNVTKEYPNGVVALKNVTVNINKGEFVFLVGPSGAGKSTFIRLIFREELPTSGQVIIAGKSIARLRPSKVAVLRRNIGVVFQDFRLLPDRTVFENVAFAMRVLQYSQREIDQRVPEVLHLVGLTSKAGNYPYQLSGGEQQRTAIARAIVNNPKILVADEPTGNLDPETSWEIMHLLYEINKRGTTLIVATHDQKIVDAMKRRVIALDRGRLVRDDQEGGYGL